MSHGNQKARISRLRGRLGERLRGRLRGGTDTEHGGEDDTRLAARVRALEEATEENRQLSQRLADVVDVVTEVLVPAADRDDARLREALAHLNRTLDDSES
jgi:Domain of unknown function (DUF6752)